MRVKLRIDKKGNKGYYYLDTFIGYQITNGVKKPQRSRESLNLSVFLNPKTRFEKDANKQAKNSAEQILLIKNQDYVSKINNLPKTHRADRKLFDYWDEYVLSTNNSNSNIQSFDSAKKKLIEYKGSEIGISDVDYKYCRDFISFLDNYKKVNGENLTSSSINSYFNKLKLVLCELVKEDIIIKNESLKVKLPKIIHKKKEVLSSDEIKKLIQTPCEVTAQRKFFLLSCFTGMRHSDIKNLKWKNLSSDNKFFKIQIQKTGKYSSIPLNEDALKVIEDRKGDNDKVILGLNYNAHNNMIIQKWAYAADIKKKVTPHTARHTFASQFYSQNKNLSILKEILGHSNISTTERYIHSLENEAYQGINDMKQLMTDED